MRGVPLLDARVLAHQAHHLEQLVAPVEHVGLDAVARPRAVEDRRGEHVEGEVGDRELLAAEVARALPVRPRAVDDQALEPSVAPL